MNGVVGNRRFVRRRLEFAAGFHRVASGLVALAIVGMVATTVRAEIIAHWSFNSINGTNQFEDDSGHNYHATIADPDPVDGNALTLGTDGMGPGFGNYAVFDRGSEISNQNSGTAGDGGPGAYAEAPHIDGIYAGSHTVAAWVKVFDETSWSGLVGDWANEPYETSRAYLYGFTGGTDNSDSAEKPMLTLSNGPQNGPINFSGASGAFDKGVWHHVAWVVDRVAADQSELSIYVDGEVFNSATFMANNGNADIQNNAGNPTWIGLKEDNGIDLHAHVDELWIVGRALNRNDIRVLAETNAVVPEPASLALVVLGLGLLGVRMRHNR